MKLEDLRVPFNNPGSMCDDSENDEDDGEYRKRGRPANKRLRRGIGDEIIPCGVI